MNRRKFLQNVFGASMIATIPKPIFNAIASTPILTKEKEEVKELHFNKHITDKVLYIVDDKNNLIAGSVDFTLTIDRPLINQTSIYSDWNEYTLGLMQWKVDINNLILPIGVSVNQFFIENEKVKILFAHHDMKFWGEAYLSYISNSYAVEEFAITSCLLEGSGGLIGKYEIEEDFMDATKLNQFNETSLLNIRSKSIPSIT